MKLHTSDYEVWVEADMEYHRVVVKGKVKWFSYTNGYINNHPVPKEAFYCLEDGRADVLCVDFDTRIDKV